MLNAIAIAALKRQYLADYAFAGGISKGDVLVLVNRLMPVPVNPPAGADLGKVTADIGEATKKVPAKALKLHTALGAGQILVTLHGETHYKPSWKGQTTPQVFEPDKERGNAIASTFASAGQTPGLIAIEAALGAKYTLTGLTASIVREEDIVHTSVLGVEARSNFVAGFIFLCLAGGDQTNADSVLLYFGGQHADIVDGLEYFALHSTGTWFRKRARSYAVIRSLQH